VSPIQQRLLDLWLGDRDDITVVGDVNQTIYSFAGATPRYLTNFPERFPHAPVVRLERSYRSTPQVVHVANSLLTSAGKPSVTLKAQRDPGPPPQWLVASDEAAEVSEVVVRIESLVASGVPLREIAVLYRINAQSVPFEEALTEAGLAYTVRGGERFFDRREVREAITLLRGAARAGAASDETGSLPDQVAAVLGGAGYQSTAPAGPSKARDRWESWAALVELARELATSDAAANLDDLVDELQQRATAAHAPSVDAVTLASLHAAKGLEWDAVFLVGLTDGMVPITYATTAEQISEERRLLYVGITRAREHLSFSFARARNAGDRRQRIPSRFLAALNSQFGGSSPQASRSASGKGRPASCRGCGRALTTATERKVRHCSQCEVDIDLALFEKLRLWRKQTADEAAVPAFVVFTDATLTAMAVERPASSADLLKIPGVGQVKVERYGAGLLGVIGGHDAASAEATRHAE
jgi:DNA helicase II / ATP-dependent DNA helicase PcrA